VGRVNGGKRGPFGMVCLGFKHLPCPSLKGGWDNLLYLIKKNKIYTEKFKNLGIGYAQTCP